MNLSNEDSLRLHVLLKNAEAVRIDENAMVVYGLASSDSTACREAKVTLNPTCRPEQYLRLVREFLSGTILGSPGGYPLFLSRWTRMGQAKDTNLAQLLMLGEPEAATAVSGAPGLTAELARRAWWAAPTTENARRMLARACVANGSMGPLLAERLVDDLPFETEAQAIIETLRLILQPGLIDEGTKLRLWERGAQRNVYRVGFLVATPDQLPQPLPARDDLPHHQSTLDALAGNNNRLAASLIRTLSGPGQTFVQTCRAVLERAADQDSVVATLNIIGTYFGRSQSGTDAPRSIDKIIADGVAACASVQGQGDQLASLLHLLPELIRETTAVLALSQVSEAMVVDILAHTSASGTVLRKKLQPTLTPIIDQLAIVSRR